MPSLETCLNEPPFPSHCSLNAVSGFQAHIHTSSLTGSVLISDPRSHLTSAVGSDYREWKQGLVFCSCSVFQFWTPAFQSYYLCTPKPCPSALISNPALTFKPVTFLLVWNTLPLQVTSQTGSPPLHNTLFPPQNLPIPLTLTLLSIHFFDSSHSNFQQFHSMFSLTDEIKLVLETEHFQSIFEESYFQMRFKYWYMTLNM